MMKMNANLHALPATACHHGQRLITASTTSPRWLDVHDAPVHDLDDRAHHDAIHSHLTWDNGRPLALSSAPRGILFRHHGDDFGYFFDDAQHGHSQFLR